MATTYLGINMSSRIFDVLNSSGSRIGNLYYKERFTYSNETKVISGRTYRKIWFLNKSGVYGEGYTHIDNPIRKWTDYYFPSLGYSPHFKIDRQTGIYDSSGNRVATANPGNICRFSETGQTGAKNKHFALLRFWVEDMGFPTFDRYKDYFIDTGVAKNSSNTAVYGNWN